MGQSPWPFSRKKLMVRTDRPSPRGRTLHNNAIVYSTQSHASAFVHLGELHMMYYDETVSVVFASVPVRFIIGEECQQRVSCIKTEPAGATICNSPGIGAERVIPSSGPATRPIPTPRQERTYAVRTIARACPFVCTGEMIGCFAPNGFRSLLCEPGTIHVPAPPAAETSVRYQMQERHIATSGNVCPSRLRMLPM